MIKVLLPLVLIIAVLGGLLFWLNSRGPFTIDCGSLDPTSCEEVWRAVAAEEEGFGSLLPVTRVRIGVVDFEDAATWCGSVYIERFIFSTLVVNDCL
jgi:hypothetical protein